MSSRSSTILTIVPYRFLPPVSGGHMSIAYLHHYLGKIAANHVISTESNKQDHGFAFKLHGILSNSFSRYLPLSSYGEIKKIAEAQHIDYICCEHPYMAPTAISLSRRLGKPWFLRSQNIESERFRSLKKKWWPILFRLERYAMRKADGVLFITHEDKDFAVRRFGLNEAKCHVVPFGTALEKSPSGREAAKAKLAAELNVDAGVPFLYFLGVLDYEPNRQAVYYILNDVLPRLNQKKITYEVIIGGKGLSDDLKQQIEAIPNVHYTGFVSDLEQFVNGCDIMLNPVMTGGGIKTKVVEALAYNKQVVSTQSGAAGLIRPACGNNLLIAADNDWDAFAGHIAASINKRLQIPALFYETYYWGNIAQHALNIMEQK